MTNTKEPNDLPALMKIIEPSKLDIPKIKETVSNNHKAICRSEYGPDIYMDTDKPIFVTKHDWRKDPYYTFDFYVICQNCNKQGYSSLRVKDEYYLNPKAKERNNGSDRNSRKS